MQENIQKYTPSDMKFSPSKLYFQHQNQILQKIGFISPMSTDIHFKYSFQEIHEDYFIEGCEYEGLTVDHDIYELGIIYKIGLSKPKFQNIKAVTVDIKANYLDNVSVWPLVRGFLCGFLIFGLLFLLYNVFKLGQVLFWLNIAGASILFLFYVWKFSELLYKKTFRTKQMGYGGLNVTYNSQSDALVLSPEIINILKTLGKDHWIIKFGYTGNCLYLLQDIHDHEGKRLINTGKLYSEQEKANLQQKTISYINNSEFLSNFISK